jgi:hypothetical protein
LIREFADELLDATSYLVLTIERAIDVSALIDLEGTLLQAQDKP